MTMNKQGGRRYPQMRGTPMSALTIGSLGTSDAVSPPEILPISSFGDISLTWAIDSTGLNRKRRKDIGEYRKWRESVRKSARLSNAGNAKLRREIDVLERRMRTMRPAA